MRARYYPRKRSMCVRGAATVFGAFCTSLVLVLALTTAEDSWAAKGGNPGKPDKPNQQVKSPKKNVAPQIAGDPSLSVESGSVYRFIVTATDANGDALTFRITNKPLWATFVDSGDSTATLSGTPTDASVGDYSDISISVTDGLATDALDPFTVSVTAADTNAVPTAQTDMATTDQGVSTVIDVLANDSGLDDTPLLVTIMSAPDQGSASVESDNGIAYTPDVDHLGSDEFTYQVKDSNGDFATASVSVTVNCLAGACTRTFHASWDRVDHPDVLGYCLYHGEQSGAPYADSNCVGSDVTFYDWTLPITNGADYFAVTTLGAHGDESAYSEEIIVMSD